MSSGVGPDAATTAEDEVPVCPRHRDRESYVRCQRCERPVCPACQRPAPVGIQCVDCVREGAKTLRTPRTVFGGRPVGTRPVVTLGVVAVCVLVWLVQRVDPALTDQLAFVPILAARQPWRFLTAAFLHDPGNILHIAFNMYALWLTGPYLEALLGRLRFAALYLVCAFGGSVGSLVLASPSAASWVTYSVGASGAVFGLFGALLIVQRRLRQDMRQIVVIIVINAVLGFLPGSNIAWQAHLGGLVTGLVLGGVLVYAPARRRGTAQLAGTAAVLLVLVVATVAVLTVRA